ncbi:MAG TPA: tetratricopeptide repeat protein, partial [Planctomycetota bacterium]|nr:tetratricopeptide repeat protein [Planctomycetota bacterium]
MPSIEAIEALLAKEPDDVFLNFSLAMALVSAGRKREALERFARTLELDARYVPAHFQRGRLLADLGREDEARAALEHGI